MSEQAPSFADAFALIRDVDGWLSPDQAERLWRAARTVPAGGRIVEIGSFRGRSTIVLAHAAAPGVEVVAIDPHGGGDRGPQEIAAEPGRGQADHQAFHENLRRAGLADRVRHVRRRSDEALGDVPGEVALLFVDGAHRYGPARDDIARWGARVPDGGTMLVHDAYNAIGVMLAQLRLLLLGSRWSYEGRSRSLAEYRRQPLSLRRRGRNALRQAAELPYFVRNLAIKVLLVARARPLANRLGHGSDPWPY